MTDAKLDHELAAFRQSLEDLASRVATGDRPTFEQVREEADMLVCLLEEAPDRRRTEIEYLLDRYLMLLNILVH